MPCNGFRRSCPIIPASSPIAANLSAFNSFSCVCFSSLFARSSCFSSVRKEASPCIFSFCGTINIKPEHATEEVKENRNLHRNSHRIDCDSLENKGTKLLTRKHNRCGGNYD